jgi:hypothetical protein
MQIVRFAKEKLDWGYKRIAGALSNIDFHICKTTVENILKRHGIEPAPERKRKTNWNQFIKSHFEVMWATDFFTVEILTKFGLITHYVLFFMPRRKRGRNDNACYHITHRCHNNKFLFRYQKYRKQSR